MRYPDYAVTCVRPLLGGFLLIALLLLLCPPQAGLGQVSDGSAPAADLVGAYFGQATPGTIPTVFAPGIVSIPSYHEHSSPVFSQDGREVYWSAQCLDVGAGSMLQFGRLVEN